MRDYQRELDALRERMAQRREDQAVLERLRRQEEDCRREVEARAARLGKEERDVEKLEKLTVSSILASLRGSKDEDMDRERAEAYAARLRLQEAERQLSEVRDEILDRQRRITENKNCEAEYEALLREKEAELRKTDPVLAEKLADLERWELELTARRKELREAEEAGKQVLFQLEGAIGHLEDAEGWGTWDVFGGGLVSDMMKYSRLDDAQQQLTGVASALRRYRAELEDVARTVEFNVKPDDFTQTMDIWFDNIFTDLAVLDRIRQSRDQLLDLKNRVRSIQEGLKWDLEKAEAELETLRTERSELVRKA